jgi:tRNA (mo5U34)-methyltransferase
LPQNRVFDMPHARALERAKVAFLREPIAEWKTQFSLKTAWDVGCGVGYFSVLLNELGFHTRALDGRKENTEEAMRRIPDLDVQVADVEDSSLPTLGEADLVFCLGLLYHLENPFRAIRNLAQLTGKLMVIESVCTWDDLPVLYLLEEGPTEDQGLRHIAFYPSEACLVKMLYRSGFSHVYRFACLPNNVDFQSSLDQTKRRTMLVASRVEISSPFVSRVPEIPATYYPWQTPWARGTKPVRRFWGFLRKPWPEKVTTMRRLLGVQRAL